MFDVRAIYEQSVESLLRGPLKDQITPELRAKLKRAGLDLDAHEGPHLSTERWRKVVDVAAKGIYPGDPRQDAHRRLAEILVDGARETMVGKAALGIGRLMGPRRVALRAQEAIQSSRHAARARVTEIGPSEFEVWVREVGISPGFDEGVLLATLEALGARGAEVSRGRRKDGGWSFRFWWRERR